MTTIHTRQLQQYTQDNYNNTHKTTNNNTHKTSQDTTCTRGKQHQGSKQHQLQDSLEHLIDIQIIKYTLCSNSVQNDTLLDLILKQINPGFH